MGKLIKKGTRGQASLYTTRTAAIRQLQISLADFRKLCIIKGIYPHLHNKRTVYYTKDIKHLLHEPLLDYLRERKSTLKKISKSIGRRDEKQIEVKEMKLDGIIKERLHSNPSYFTRGNDGSLCNTTLLLLLDRTNCRYPSFVDALNDMDDCLSHISLFSLVDEESRKLMEEFKRIVERNGLLRRVFVSIKGVYYQVQICGVDVTWITPHEFQLVIPDDVDLRVMRTYLELYKTLLGFVCYRLASGERGADGGREGESSVSRKGEESATPTTLNRKQLRSIEKRISNIKEKEEEEEEQQENEEIINDSPSLPSSSPKRLFSSLSFTLSREVPSHIEFIIKSLGGTISESGGSIVIIDRPLAAITPNTIYVQPQWVYDCLNENSLLEYGVYAPGKTLPPHKSPFKEYEFIEEEEEEEQVEVEEDGVVDDDDDIVTEESPEIEKEENLAKLLLSNKKRKLVERIEARQDEEKRERENRLRRKKK